MAKPEMPSEGKSPTTPREMSVVERGPSPEFVELARAEHITVLLPARNEESTIAPIVEKILDRYTFASRTLVKVVVIDDHSNDATHKVAEEAGAVIVSRTGADAPTGKAETILDGILEHPSDVYVLLDADIENFEPHWIELLCSVLVDPSVVLAKGTYKRPVSDGLSAQERFFEGGRVTELVARPLLSLCFPELARFGQPLSGEIAFRSSLTRAGSLIRGYGFDVGLLIDTYQTFGLDSIREVDLGTRSHNHQDLKALAFQSRQVAMTILEKAGIDVAAFPGASMLIRNDGSQKHVPFGHLSPPLQQSDFS